MPAASVQCFLLMDTGKEGCRVLPALGSMWGCLLFSSLWFTPFSAYLTGWGRVCRRLRSGSVLIQDSSRSFSLFYPPLLLLPFGIFDLLLLKPICCETFRNGVGAWAVSQTVVQAQALAVTPDVSFSETSPGNVG